MKTGVIHGRFQGLHNGHMEYLLTAKKRCDFLVIGITNFLGNAVDSEISRIDDHRLRTNKKFCSTKCSLFYDHL